MQELVITPSTLVFLGIILVFAALAVHRLTRKGMCDCNDHCSGSCHSARGGCSCNVVDDMVSKMEAAVKNE